MVPPTHLQRRIGDTMADTSKLPRWQSHKIVHAAKIAGVNGDQIILDVDGETHSVTAAPNMFVRYMPVPGDFYVVYEDGFASISPRQAFEEGYHRL
jgi:hypothetical protein